MPMDLEALLAPVSEEAPAGPDLEYDPEFIELDTAARGKSEQQFGDTVIPAEEPNWRDIGERAEALLGRSKDLRVAILAARAAMKTRDIEGLASGLQLITEVTTRYWDSVHPDLDHDDGDDPTMRLNALAPLVDPESFLRDVRNAYLVSSPQHGRVAIRDILISEGKLPPSGDKVFSTAEIAAIVEVASAQNRAPLESALQCVETVKTLEALLGEKGVLSQAPDLRPLMELLQAAASVSAEVLHMNDPDSAAGDGAGDDNAPGQEGRAQSSGQITSREDAIRLLEKVCKYIEQAEPSNPAPLFIRRAQRLMSRNFMEIIADLAPDILGQIQKLAGLEEK